MSKKLYRSRNDRMIAGVCGGIADYFNVDSTLIRLAVLFIFLFEGTALIAYLIAWFLISEEPIKNEYKMPDDYYLEENNFSTQSAKEEALNRDDQENSAFSKKGTANSRRKLLAVIIIIIGIISLADIWIPSIYWQKYWPLILIAAGFLMLKGDQDDR